MKNKFWFWFFGYRRLVLVNQGWEKGDQNRNRENRELIIVWKIEVVKLFKRKNNILKNII